MENNNECEQNNDDLPLEYFHRWRKRGQKSKMIYIRVRPEEKETILIACNKSRPIHIGLCDRSELGSGGSGYKEVSLDISKGTECWTAVAKGESL